MDFKDRLDARDLKQQRETQEKTQQQSKLMSALRAYLETLGPQVADACAKQGKDTSHLDTGNRDCYASRDLSKMSVLSV
jgi:hypothetical protein